MFYILVVLYEKNIFKSETINSILNSLELINNSTIILWDNSREYQDKDLLEFQNILEYNNINLIYKHTPENLGLSKIYNNLIKGILKKEMYLCLFDDDSSFNKDYFYILLKAITQNDDENIFIPQIKYKEKIVSPFHIYMYKGFKFKFSIGKNISKNIYAINSGLCINTNFLLNNSFEYDERLQFYGTDIFLFKKYYETRNNIFILDYTMKHDLSLHSTNYLNNSLVKRYCEYYRSIRILNNNSFGINIYIFFHKVLLSIMKKRINFF